MVAHIIEWISAVTGHAEFICENMRIYLLFFFIFHHWNSANSNKFMSYILRDMAIGDLGPFY